MHISRESAVFLFFCTDTSTTEIYTLSLHDALPISVWGTTVLAVKNLTGGESLRLGDAQGSLIRSEEHTSELQSRVDLVCRLLLEKKNCGSPRAGPCLGSRSFNSSVTSSICTTLPRF